MMNNRGFLILIIIVALLVVIIVPGIIMQVSPIARLIFTLIIILMIIGMVQSYLGPGKLTWLIAGILIYIAIRNIEIVTSVYALYIILGTGLGSVVVWGIGTSRLAHG